MTFDAPAVATTNKSNAAQRSRIAAARDGDILILTLFLLVPYNCMFFNEKRCYEIFRYLYLSL